MRVSLAWTTAVALIFGTSFAHSGLADNNGAEGFTAVAPQVLTGDKKQSPQPNINMPAVLKSIEEAQKGFKGQFLFLAESNHRSTAQQALSLNETFYRTLIRIGYPVYVDENVRKIGDPLVKKISKTYAYIDERMDLGKVLAEIDKSMQIQIQEATPVAKQTGESLDDAEHRLEACQSPEQRKYHRGFEKDVHFTAVTADAIRHFANGRRTVLSYGLEHGFGEGELFELLGGRKNVRLVVLYDNREAMVEHIHYEGMATSHYTHRPDAAILLDTGELIMPAPAPDMSCKPPPKINAPGRTFPPILWQ